jgi:hypothetical protein
MFRLLTVLLILLGLLFTAVGCNNTNHNSLTTINPSASTTTSPGISTPLKTYSLTEIVSTGKELKFEKVGFVGNVGGSYQGSEARIYIINTLPKSSSEELKWLLANYQEKIMEVDYSKYFVILAFNGFRYGIFSLIDIINIRQNADTVFVIAHFNDIQPEATSLQSTNSQYYAVKITREQIVGTGSITLRLLDEKGQERAITIAHDLINKKQ